MIIVTVALHPFGTAKASKVWYGTIINDGTGTVTRGNYKATFLTLDGKVWKRSEIKGFPRKSRGIWRLLCKALNGVR